MKIREIELGDVFLASKLLKKIDLKKLLQEVGMENVTGKSSEEKKAAMDEKAIDFFLAMLTHIDEAEKEIMALLAAWAQITPEEAKKIKLSEMKEFVKQFIEINGAEAITSFFEKAAGLMQQKR